MYKTIIEDRKPIKVVARLFLGPDGQWEVRPGAVVVYAAEQSTPSTEMLRFQSIDTGETRPTNAGMVEWLEEKARRGVREALRLDEQESLKLLIESEIKIEP
jgi:hypothetical protein